MKIRFWKMRVAALTLMACFSVTISFAAVCPRTCGSESIETFMTIESAENYGKAVAHNAVLPVGTSLQVDALAKVIGSECNVCSLGNIIFTGPRELRYGSVNFTTPTSSGYDLITCDRPLQTLDTRTGGSCDRDNDLTLSTPGEYKIEYDFSIQNPYSCGNYIDGVTCSTELTASTTVYAVDDCDLSDPNIPGLEICNDGIDNDCDSNIDCEDTNCSSEPVCNIRKEDWPNQCSVTNAPSTKVDSH